jgi:hypothetical protein
MATRILQGILSRDGATSRCLKSGAPFSRPAERCTRGGESCAAASHPHTRTPRSLAPGCYGGASPALEYWNGFMAVRRLPVENLETPGVGKRRGLIVRLRPASGEGRRAPDRCARQIARACDHDVLDLCTVIEGFRRKRLRGRRYEVRSSCRRVQRRCVGRRAFPVGGRAVGRSSSVAPCRR